jgi:putative membrane protein
MVDYDPKSFLRVVTQLRGSVIPALLPRILLCTGIGAGAAYLHFNFAFKLPSIAHTLLGVALGLLLVFRTNASYDRFWEGRKQWGGIVNEARNLARTSTVLLREAPDLHLSILRWTAAWPYAAMASLRGKRSLGPVAELLPADERKAALAAQHVPLAVAVRISRDLDEARRRGVISDYQQMTLDQNVQLLIDYVGACERIHKTPLPFAYVVHLRRALILYCFSLPFALIDTFHWATLGLVFVLAYTFFGIEEIGVEIEDPFGTDDNDLPLEKICATIQANVLALAEEGGAGELDD